MTPADDIKRQFENAELETHPDTDEQIFAEMVQIQQTTQRTSPATPVIWRIIMRSRITQLTVAAMVAIVVFTGLSWWTQTGSGIALAEVLTHMQQVQTLRYRMNTSITAPDQEDKPLAEGVVLMSEEHGIKWSVDISLPIAIYQETYILPHKNSITYLLPRDKKYAQTEFDQAALIRWQKETDPRNMVADILACDHMSLGKSTLDGIEVEGFQTTDPNYMNGSVGLATGTVWVSTETELPVLLEINTNRTGAMHMKLVLSDFQWNVSAQPRDFEPVIPDDYTPGRPLIMLRPGDTSTEPSKTTMDPERAQQEERSLKMMAAMDEAVGDEETAIQALRRCAELVGSYPNDLSTAMIMQHLGKMDSSPTPASQALGARLSSMTQKEKEQFGIDMLTTLQGLAKFYQSLEACEYYGDRVTPETPKTVLMRWKISDTEYRVIFSDLHTETVPENMLVELEKSLPTQ